jgi:hypothetical protein
MQQTYMPTCRFASTHPTMVDRLVLFAPITRREPRRYEKPPPLLPWRVVTLEDQWEQFVEDVPEHEPPVLSRRHFEDWGERYLTSARVISEAFIRNLRCRLARATHDARSPRYPSVVIYQQRLRRGRLWRRGCSRRLQLIGIGSFATDVGFESPVRLNCSKLSPTPLEVTRKSDLTNLKVERLSQSLACAM